MTKKTKTVLIIGIAFAAVCFIALCIITAPVRRREKLRYEYEARQGMHEDLFTGKITNAPKGSTPEQAFNLYFKNGEAHIVFDYDNNICVMGRTKVGEMVAAVLSDTDGSFRVIQVFDRGSDYRTIEMKGDAINQSCFVQFFLLPRGNNSNEIVHAILTRGDGSPSDTNQATFHSFQDGSDALFQHWYAVSDIDKKGYCVYWDIATQE